MNTRYANYTTVFNLLTASDVDHFRLVSEGVPYTPEIGPHGGIHYTIGGDVCLTLTQFLTRLLFANPNH